VSGYTVETVYEQEYNSFYRSPDWELKNIQKALNMMPFLNGSRENARLQAVTDILAQRKVRR
jgi:hypothetical protein